MPASLRLSLLAPGVAPLSAAAEEEGQQACSVGAGLAGSGGGQWVLVEDGGSWWRRTH